MDRTQAVLTVNSQLSRKSVHVCLASYKITCSCAPCPSAAHACSLQPALGVQASTEECRAAAHLAGTSQLLCRAPVTGSWTWRQLKLLLLSSLLGAAVLLQLLLGLLQLALNLQQNDRALVHRPSSLPKRGQSLCRHLCCQRQREGLE